MLPAVAYRSSLRACILQMYLFRVSCSHKGHIWAELWWPVAHVRAWCRARGFTHGSCKTACGRERPVKRWPRTWWAPGSWRRTAPTPRRWAAACPSCRRWWWAWWSARPAGTCVAAQTRGQSEHQASCTGLAACSDADLGENISLKRSCQTGRWWRTSGGILALDLKETVHLPQHVILSEIAVL